MAINGYRISIKNAPDYFEPKISLVACLREAGYENLADIALKAMIKFYGATEKPLLYQLINYEVESAANQNRNINPNLEVVLRHIDKSEEGPERLPNHWFSLSQICCSKNQLREAIDFIIRNRST